MADAWGQPKEELVFWTKSHKLSDNLEGETWSEDQVGRGPLQIDGVIMYFLHLLVQSYLMPGSLRMKLGEFIPFLNGTTLNKSPISAFP